MLFALPLCSSCQSPPFLLASKYSWANSVPSWPATDMSFRPTSRHRPGNRAARWSCSRKFSASTATSAPSPIATRVKATPPSRPPCSIACAAGNSTWLWTGGQAAGHRYHATGETRGRHEGCGGGYCGCQELGPCWYGRVLLGRPVGLPGRLRSAGILRGGVLRQDRGSAWTRNPSVR